MKVNNTIEVVNTDKSVKQALENEYRGCEVNEEECTVFIDGIRYRYNLIKHMDDVALSLYSIYELDKDNVIPLSDELSTLFDKYSDGYFADEEFMSKTTFIEVVTELFKAKGY